MPDDLGKDTATSRMRADGKPKAVAARADNNKKTCSTCQRLMQYSVWMAMSEFTRMIDRSYWM